MIKIFLKKKIQIQTTAITLLHHKCNSEIRDINFMNIGKAIKTKCLKVLCEI